MAKILFTIYILAMFLMFGIIYSLVSYINWARYEMITQKLIIYIRVLFGNAYLVSMVENESLIQHHLCNRSQCEYERSNKINRIIRWSLAVIVFSWLVIDLSISAFLYLTPYDDKGRWMIISASVIICFFASQTLAIIYQTLQLYKLTKQLKEEEMTRVKCVLLTIMIIFAISNLVIIGTLIHALV